MIWDYELNKYLYHAYFDIEKMYTLAEQIDLIKFLEVNFNYKKISDRFFAYAKNSAVYYSRERLILTHAEAIKESVLFSNYATITLEIFRIFLFTMSDSERTESLTMKPLIMKIFKESIDSLKAIKSGPVYDKIWELLEDLKAKLLDTKKIELDSEILRHLPTDSPVKIPRRSVSSFFNSLIANDDQKKKGINLVSVFRKSFQNKGKNGGVVVNEVCETLRKAFREILQQDYLEEYSEAEFQELIYKGRDKDKLRNFEGFLKGIIRHIRPEQKVERNIKLLGLNLLTIYIKQLVNEKDVIERKKRQKFLFNCKLDQLLCNLISTSEDSEIVFQSLLTAQYLVECADEDDQLSFMNSVIESDSYNFLQKPLMYIREYMINLERSVLLMNRNYLLYHMFGEGHPKEDADLAQIIKYRANICLFFTFLKTMCKGHNTKIQQFLRHQSHQNSKRDVRRSINIIQEAHELLKTATRFIGIHSIQLIIDILQFLTESILGPCIENQSELMTLQIFSSLKEILAEINTTDEEGLKIKGFSLADENANVLLNSCYDSTINLFLALIESNTKKSLLLEIADIIPFEVFMNRLTLAFDNLIPSAIKERHNYPENISIEQIIASFKEPIFSKELQIVFNLFILFITIEDNCQHYTPLIQALHGKQKLAFDFFKLNTQNIEVIFSGKILKQFFIKYPSCYYFSEKNKLDFLNTAKRDTPNQKLTDFVQKSPDMFNEMDYIFKLKKNFKVDPKYSWYLRIAALLICYLVNLYILIVGKMKVQGGEGMDDKDEYNISLFTFFVIIYIVLLGMSLFLFFVDTVQIKRINLWSSYIREMKNLGNITSADKQYIQGFLNKGMMNLTSEDYYALIKFKRIKEGNSSSTPRIIKLINDLKFVDRQFLLMAFYLVCFVSGLITGDYVLYSIPLFDTLVCISNQEHV
jgi:hypothetical protein